MKPLPLAALSASLLGSSLGAAVISPDPSVFDPDPFPAPFAYSSFPILLPLGSGLSFSFNGSYSGTYSYYISSGGTAGGAAGINSNGSVSIASTPLSLNGVVDADLFGNSASWYDFQANEASSFYGLYSNGYYGWVQLSVANRVMTLEGMAFNTVQGQGLYAGTLSAVPEPSTYGLILGGLALAGAALRRRRKAPAR